MGASLQKALEWTIENSPPPVVVFIIVVILIVLLLWLSYRLNKLISGVLSKEQARDDRIAAVEKEQATQAKQQRKSEQLAEKLPCVVKGNATWLQDKTRNGGQPPEPCVCAYLKAKDEGEI